MLHFRGVPLDVTDSEILQLSLPFGNVTNLVVSKKKNQVGTAAGVSSFFIRVCVEVEHHVASGR